MPRTAANNERLKEERREDLLTAALRVFARQGLTGTKMADLAAAAGVSYGLVYHYFPTKEAVYNALIEQAVQGAAALLEQTLRGPGSPWDRLVALTVAILEGVRHNADYPLFIARAQASEELPLDARSMLDRHGRAMVQTVTDLVRHGQATGQVVAGDPDELARVYLATLQGLSVGGLVLETSTRPLPRVDTVLRVLKG